MLIAFVRNSGWRVLPLVFRAAAAACFLIFTFEAGSLRRSSEAAPSPPPSHPPGTSVPAADPEPRVTCSFSHPSYSGLCKQTETLSKGTSGKEACESILECLNDSRCIKTYCDATTIRGGWKLESVEVTPEEK